DRGHPGSAAATGRAGADPAPFRRRRGGHRGRGSPRTGDQPCQTRHDLRGALLRPAGPPVHREGVGHLAGGLQGQTRAQRPVHRQGQGRCHPSGDVRPDRPGHRPATGTADAGRRPAARRRARLRPRRGRTGDLADHPGANRGAARRQGGGAERRQERRSRRGPGGHSAETRGGAGAAVTGPGRRGCRAGRDGPMNTVIEAALRLRWVVLLLTVGVVALGCYAYTQQPIDAYPDISAQMVQIITMFPGRAPEEVERQVTIPVENAMLATPRVETVRSRTIFGLSLVQLMFEEGTEAYWARQRVAEQLREVD